jgi:hypothetical protein
LESFERQHVWQSMLELLGLMSGSTHQLAGRRAAKVVEEGSWAKLQERIASLKLARERAAKKQRNSNVGKSAKSRRPATALSARVEVVDRVSERAIVVDWCDATVGHYGEQLWTRGVARLSSRCVLSGQRIRRGDLVYHPSMRGHCPANRKEAILACILDVSGDSAGDITATSQIPVEREI